MTLLDGVRLGVQEPRVLLRPQGIAGSSGPEATELAAACGLILDPWQESALELSMAERADGSWAAAQVSLIASRQNGKNGIIEARELFGLAVLGEWIIHTSHLFTTTKESYNRLLGYIEANSDVKNCLARAPLASPASGYKMEFKSGGRITFIARSRSSGRGLTGDLLVFDEAQDLNDDAQGALLPTISARPGAQAWYMGSAPDIGSTILHRIRKRGRSGLPGRLAYMEHSADPECDPDDREAWAQANPAFGIRITEETIETERDAMSPEQFLRERLSVSPDIEDIGAVIPRATWDAVCSEDTGDRKVSAFALDVNPERSAASIVAAGEGSVIELVEYRAGLGWVLERAAELHARYGVGFVIDKNGPAGSFVDEMTREKLDVIELDGRDLARASGNFYDRVLEPSITVRQNSDLDAAVMGAAKRPVGDSWAWGRKSSKVDVSPLVAASLALWGFQEDLCRSKRSKYEDDEMVVV